MKLLKLIYFFIIFLPLKKNTSKFSITNIIFFNICFSQFSKNGIYYDGEKYIAFFLDGTLGIFNKKTQEISKVYLGNYLKTYSNSILIHKEIIYLAINTPNSTSLFITYNISTGQLNVYDHDTAIPHKPILYQDQILIIDDFHNIYALNLNENNEATVENPYPKLKRLYLNPISNQDFFSNETILLEGDNLWIPLSCGSVEVLNLKTFNTEKISFTSYPNVSCHPYSIFSKNKKIFLFTSNSINVFDPITLKETQSLFLGTNHKVFKLEENIAFINENFLITGQIIDDKIEIINQGLEICKRSMLCDLKGGAFIDKNTIILTSNDGFFVIDLITKQVEFFPEVLPSDYNPIILKNKQIAILNTNGQFTLCKLKG